MMFCFVRFVWGVAQRQEMGVYYQVPVKAERREIDMWLLEL